MAKSRVSAIPSGTPSRQPNLTPAQQRGQQLMEGVQNIPGAKEGQPNNDGPAIKISTKKVKEFDLNKLLQKVETMPAPIVSDFETEQVLGAYLQLNVYARTPGNKKFFGRKGFSLQEVVREIVGDDINPYELKKAVDDLNSLLGYSLIDDPQDIRSSMPESARREEPNQIPGPPYVPGGLMSRGLVVYVPRAGNRGRGFAFNINLERVRAFLDGLEDEAEDEEEIEEEEELNSK